MQLLAFYIYSVSMSYSCCYKVHKSIASFVPSITLDEVGKALNQRYQFDFIYKKCLLASEQWHHIKENFGKFGTTNSPKFFLHQMKLILAFDLSNFSTAKVSLNVVTILCDH